MKTSNSVKPDIYDQITERIIAMLEKGTVPWRKTWQVQRGFPRNLVSRKPYRGINTFLLHSMRYESPFWLTYRQAMELGSNVRKGEKACPVVFWKKLEIEDEATGEVEKIAMARFYFVFNVAQCEGLKNISAPSESELQALSKPDAIVNAMPNRPEIRHGLTEAFYSPAKDFVAMPNRNRFDSENEYFSTLFHELIHSTAHPSRLNRPLESKKFGSDPYCKEELIAEMGSAFLCGHAGIFETTVENSASYLQGWMKQLKDDKKLIVQAAALAQKATDFILGSKYEEASTDSTELRTPLDTRTDTKGIKKDYKK